MFRFSFSIVVALIISGLLAFQVYTRYLRSPLNLIVITVDCARSDRMGFNGYERDTTHYLNELVKDGVSFTQAYSQAAWTSPGVISTLTGLYPPTHGVTAQGRTVPKSVYTLLDGFKERGYRVPKGWQSVLFGGWCYYYPSEAKPDC